ncbi:MAG TPA: P-type conjugative transfer protein TrbL [Brevundimonas sp.]|uniref:P-type conjugative transfer protein TrbL n=1 Tax=Brevundimonas sp. TaxID=1871086 RepID=UPI000E87739C|nr:P-type conjugative transfer protein TrbL [Brevundimonas sp.]HBI20161.1 P-type conjugative transfer protein TrbL [Brevundimonas sp.]
MNDVGVIDRFFEVFGRYIDSGFGLLGGEVAFLASTLVVIDVTLAALFWAWGPGDDILARLVKKTLFVGFFAFLIGNFQRLADIVFASFSGLGLKASGSGLSAADFMRPGKLAQTGVEAGRPMLEAAAELSGFPGLFENFVQVMVLMVAFLIVIVAFFVLAVQLFVTLIEFKLTTLAGFVLIPFGLFGRTAFLAEKVLGNVVASGVKVLVLAVIVGIGSTLFESFTRDFAGAPPTLEDVLAIALAALTLMGLSIFGPGVATGLVSGAPQLGAGAAVGAGLAVGGLAMAGAAGARLAAAGGSSLAGRVGAGRVGAGAAATRATPSRGGSSTGGTGPARPTGPSGGSPPSAPPVSGAGGAATTGKPSAPSAPTTPPAASSSPAAPAAPSPTQPATPSESSPAPGDPAAPAATAPAAVGAAKPAWARAMERRQAVSRGLTTAVHAVRSGDHGGGGGSVSLSEDRS